MRTLARTVSRTLVILLVVGGPVQARDLASNIAVHIDRDRDRAPTPIHQQYLSLIRSANGGDEIILLQKVFRNKKLNRALVDAAGRGVKVTGIYRDDVRPRCEDLLPPRSSIDCCQLFIRNGHVHHKSMVLHRRNGNPRPSSVRSTCASVIGHPPVSIPCCLSTSRLMMLSFLSIKPMLTVFEIFRLILRHS